MFCPNCGTQIQNTAAFCPNCGTRLAQPVQQPVQQPQTFSQTVYRDATNTANQFDRQFNSALNEVGQTFNQNTASGVTPLKTDRSLLVMILLNIVTCGIYSWFFIYSIAKDLNTACAGDGDNTPGLGMFILLSLVTCGIYSLIYYYKIGNRLANNAPRYGMNFQENGTTVLLWIVFGSMICGVGSLIGFNIVIKNTNQICAAYNHYNGLA